MIIDRGLTVGVGAALIVALGLAGSVKLGEMARARERDTAISERDKSEDKADQICGRANSSFRVYDRKTGKPLRVEFGKDCDQAVNALQIRVNGEQGRLTEALVKLKAENDAKYEADKAAFRRNLIRQTESLKSLEAADAAITNGHYPDRWWIALGDTLGLRERAAEVPAPAEPGPAGGGDQGAAPR